VADAAPLYLGLISGTSADGIDVALVRFATRLDVVATRTFAYPDGVRAGRLDAGEFPLVGAVAGDALHDPVVLGDLVFHNRVEIREDTQGQRHPVPQRRQAGDGLAAGDVVHAVGGDEFIGDSEVALVEDLLDNAAGPGLQLVRGHGLAPWVSCRLA